MGMKKWHENIPASGVLCKCNGNFIALVTRYDAAHEGMPFIGSGQRFNKDVPLTAAEWWIFAPWQDMDSAPLRKAILVMEADGVILNQMLLASFERENYIKWLPLPKADK